jgi:uncharacterized membrane protein YphA (DoxX/SURF4 family)
MNTALWVVQVLLALAFGMSGLMKATQPYDTVKARMTYAEDFSPGVIRLIGILEVLAATGLILPALTGILPILTPLAAVGLVLTMIGAMLTHLRRREPGAIVFNLVLLALAAFVAYGRFVVVPLTA